MKKNNLLIIFATLFLIKSCSDDPELIPGNVSLISPINNELCENGDDDDDDGDDDDDDGGDFGDDADDDDDA